MTSVEAIAWNEMSLLEGVSRAKGTALGTTVAVVVWPASRLDAVLSAVESEVAALDLQASRFRPDSEISRVNASTSNVFLVSDGFSQVLHHALAAARLTGGLVDPTIGGRLIRLGYDRDFAQMERDSQEPQQPHDPVQPELWREIGLEGNLLRRPLGAVLDVGATAKGLGADRAARAAQRYTGKGGVLVSLGGDIAVAGVSPRGGWPIAVSEDPSTATTDSEVVRLSHGGIATSSTVCRTWRRGGQRLHHIIDPRTGMSAAGPWRTVTVIAGSCVSANTASTAAILAGFEAEQWLATQGFAARLVGRDGVAQVVGEWPSTSDSESDLRRSTPGTAA